MVLLRMPSVLTAAQPSNRRLIRCHLILSIMSTMRLQTPSLYLSVMAAHCVIQGQFQPNFMACLDTAAPDPYL